MHRCGFYFYFFEKKVLGAKDRALDRAMRRDFPGEDELCKCELLVALMRSEAESPRLCSVAMRRACRNSKGGG